MNPDQHCECGRIFDAYNARTHVANTGHTLIPMFDFVRVQSDSSARSYIVTKDKNPAEWRCSCAAFALQYNRKGGPGYQCKHIAWVLARGTSQCEECDAILMPDEQELHAEWHAAKADLATW